MRVLLLSLSAALLFNGPATAQAPDSGAAYRTAYLDSTAKQLVTLARARRQVADLSIDAYKALSKERMSIGLRGLRRDRLLYRREVAGRIEWTRNGAGKIEVLGAREAIPVAIKGVQLPSDLGAFMPHLAFDPADPRMFIGEDGNDFIRFPLAPGAEQYYQFKTGGTTSIQLPDGKIVRLVELDVLPRAIDSHNVTGSFWLEAQTHSIVQAAFRLTKEVDVLKDMDDDPSDEKDMPGFMKPITFSIDYVTIEYALFDLQWWMPRSVLFQGSLRAGFLRTPMQYERTYGEYEIHAAAKPVIESRAALARSDSVRNQNGCRRPNSITITAKSGQPGPTHPKVDSTIVMTCGRWQITMSNDTAALVNSPDLPENAFATGEELVTEGELKQLQRQIEKLGGGPGMLPTPVTDASALALRQMRYNRIEGLSVGAQAKLDYGALTLNGSMRLGIADRGLKPEAALRLNGQHTTLTVGGYYNRLNAFDPTARPFSLGSSLSSLMFGRDDADYFRSRGAEVLAEPAATHARWYSLRLFAQQELPVSKKTDFSFRHLLNGDYEFRPNLLADREKEYGGELTLRFNHGVNPGALRFGGELYGHAASGTNDFARSALTLRANFPLHGPLAGALEGAAGLTSVNAPVQHRWYLGGSTTLRGYNADVISGDAFWRGRAELGYGMPAVRLVGFSDVGWAGPRDRWSDGKPLLGVGAGASFLDGIIRMDVARGLRGPKGWSASLYFDATL